MKVERGGKRRVESGVVEWWHMRTGRGEEFGDVSGELIIP